MTTLIITYDVIREALARRSVLGMLLFVLLGIVTLAFALDLDVVDGALAASKLFGNSLGGAITPVDVALQTVFSTLAYLVFYVGIFFGITALSGQAQALLAPGRVEHLLGLPVRRFELVFGIYLGVICIIVLISSVAIAGVSLVLLVKAKFFTVAPMAGASMALIGFLPVYAVMLLATTIARSSALASGVGTLFFFVCALTSNREAFLSVFDSGLTRSVLSVLIAPLPRLHAIADIGAMIASGQHVQIPLTALLSALAFTAACLAAAAFVVESKDY